jgi:polar amino acid transport system substrate-binding protein
MLRIASISAVFLFPLMAGCAGTTNMSVPRAELAPTGVLRVALFTGNPVIATRNKATGELGGTTYILAKALAERAGVGFAPIEYTAVAKLMEDAKTGAWDIAVVAFDPARRNVIDFAPPHMIVDLTYLVPPGSSIRSVAEADQPGVRIAAARGAATTLFLQRTLKQAELMPAENEPAAFDLIKQGKAQAYAQNRTMLLGLAKGLPGARVLEDRFSAAEMTLVLPKGRPAALAYVNVFVEQSKSSGVVLRAIEASGLRGVSVAPGM